MSLHHQVLRQLTIPLANRRFVDAADVLGRMDDVHPFDVSAVLPAAGHLAVDIDKRPQKCGKLAFLPAQRTWLEVGRVNGEGCAFYMEQSGSYAHVAGIFDGPDGFESRWMFRLPLAWPEASGWSEIEWGWNSEEGASGDDWNDAAEMVCALYALLAMINTPRIIGRRQRMPHAGLQRELARAMGMTGKFPLLATTEILLEVTPPKDMGGHEPVATHLSGGKALHWVRSHLRVRIGSLELVSAHWRGDPSLGIKQSRYAVVPPRNGIWPKLAA